MIHRFSMILARFSPLFSRWLLSLLVVGGAAGVFMELAEDVWIKEGFSWDAPLMRTIHRLNAPWLDTLMKAITFTAGSAAVIIAAAIILWLWHQQHRLDAITLFVTLSGMVAMTTVLKLVFARPRPDVFPPLTVEHSYSFPSGHTATAVALYGLLAVLLWRAHRYGWALLCGLWVPTVAFSRVYLGVHYPSDVLGSLTLGLIWLTAVMIVYDTRSNPAPAQL